MGRTLRHILVFVLLLMALGLALDPVFTRLFQNGRGMKSQWLARMHHQHFDAVIMGSSRALWNINTIAIDTTCDVRVVNLANNHLTPAEFLLTLKIFLRNGNRADRILLQVDQNTLSTDADLHSSKVYEYVPYLDDTLVYEHLRARDSEWFWLKHVPFWRYVKYNFKWGVEQAFYSVLDRSPEPFDSTGAFFSPNEQFYLKKDVNFPRITDRLGTDLEAVFELCRTNGIEVVPFTAPSFRRDMPDSVRAFPARLLAAHGHRLLDFSDSLDGQHLFNDNKHFNRAGGALFTRMLIEQVICPANADQAQGREHP